MQKDQSGDVSKIQNKHMIIIMNGMQRGGKRSNFREKNSIFKLQPPKSEMLFLFKHFKHLYLN